MPGRDRRPAQTDGQLHRRRHRRDGGAHPAHLPGRREGPAGCHGTAADQPPVGLPGLRQGRRVPAAEPGDGHRPGRDPVHRHQAHLPQTDSAVQRGAAGPRALRAVRPLHPLLHPDRRRPVHRTARTRRAAAGRHRPRRRLRLLLQRQHRADLPGRRTHRGRLPLPRPPLRPGVLPQRLRTLRVGLCAAHRSPPRRGAAAAGRGRPGGQRGVELRQGTLGLRLHPGGRPHRHPDGARRRHPARGLVVGGPHPGGGGADQRPHRRARRRAGDERGRLRLRQVRANSAAHQRYRLSIAPPFGGGDAVPHPPRQPAGEVDLRRPGDRTGRGARRIRARGGVTDRLPAAPQGGPSAWTAGGHTRTVHFAGGGQTVRPAGSRRSRRRGGGPDRTGRTDARGHRHPGGGTVGHQSRGVLGGGPGRGTAGVDPTPCRRARGTGGRLPADPASRRPPGRRSPCPPTDQRRLGGRTPPR